MSAGAETTTFYDASFARRIERLLGEKYAAARPRLEAMGAMAATEIDRLAALADRNPPTLHSFDREGRRVDEVRFHESYETMRRLAYGSGMIAGAYSNQGRDPHALTFALGHLFGMAEAGLYCPICMTDGAARVLERFAPPELARRFVPRLGAREAPVYEGAMWLTERQGGSDVGANDTRAAPAEGARGEKGLVWYLTGEKYFCSNLGAEVTLVLARPDGAGPGTGGLALFLVPAHLEDGKRNPGLRYRRLKDKLGTRSMATGEVELDRAVGYLITGAGQGFKAMADMLNMSRLYNAVASCACMRRAWVEAARYAETRTSFGRKLADHPLQQEVIADLAVQCEGATALVFEAIRRLDLIDAGSKDPEDKALLRALTPLVKLHTGRLAVTSASEAVEALGGNGYVEEYPTARLLRDAQVLPIWEGTTNILSLDFVFRACGKDRGHEALARFGERLLEGVTHAALVDARERAREDLKHAAAGVDAALGCGDEAASRDARALAKACAEAMAGALLLAEAQRDLDERQDARGALLALRYHGCGPSLDALRYRSLAHCTPADPALLLAAVPRPAISLEHAK